MQYRRFGHRSRYLLPLLIIGLAWVFSVSDAKAGGTAFVGINGTHFTLNGQSVTLKGTNYYLRFSPWADMWGQWNGPQVDKDISRAATLGINTLRILVPGGQRNNWMSDATTVNATYLTELRQFVQIAGQHNMRVIVTLFDFEDFSSAGSAADSSQMAYLRTIVGTFANDDRILAWDLHNEPDGYDGWNWSNPKFVIDWIYRYAAAIRTLDPNHLVTVGTGRYDQAYTPDSQGRIIANVVDFVCEHNYDAGQVGNQLEWLRKRTTKPILLEETGWPTGPITPDHPNYTEADQVQMFRAAFAAAQRFDVAGIVQWQLYDTLPTGSLTTDLFDTYYNNFFGFFRVNDTPKPSAAVFAQEYTAAPLPSSTTSALPLTMLSQTPQIRRAYYFPLTDRRILSPFRDVWRIDGGFATFGYPVTEELKEGGMLVQYFENMKLEYHPERMKDPDYKTLTNDQKAERTTDVSPIGAAVRTLSLGAQPLSAQLQAGASVTFSAYYAGHNGGHFLGNPLGTPFLEIDPLTHTSRAVQYYDRGELEYHPELAASVRPARAGLLLAQQKGYLTAELGGLPVAAFADASFGNTWQRTDAPVSQNLTSRSWVWGPQGFDSTIEEYADSPGGMRQVEYFDKTRMEINHPAATAVDTGLSQTVNDGDNSANLTVTNGLLVREMIAGQIQVGDNAYLNSTPAQIPLAGDPANTNPTAPTYASLHNLATLNGTDHPSPNRSGANVTDFLNKDGSLGNVAPSLANSVHLTAYQSTTSHNIADVFWSYMTNSTGPVYENGASTLSNGQVINWLFAVGLPISEPYWTRARVGGVEKDVLVQAFERRILTYTPTNAPAWRVEMGNVGRHYHTWRYGS